MSDTAMWREKAAMLRDRATETADVDRRRVLLTLAEDCDEVAAAIEEDDGGIGRDNRFDLRPALERP